MKNKKAKKGYVLAIVIILTFVMTVTVASTFTLVMRYMTIAKRDLNSFQQKHQENVITLINEEVSYNA